MRHQVVSNSVAPIYQINDGCLNDPQTNFRIFSSKILIFFGRFFSRGLGDKLLASAWMIAGLSCAFPHLSSASFIRTLSETFSLRRQELGQVQLATIIMYSIVYKMYLNKSEIMWPMNVFDMVTRIFAVCN